MLTTLVCRGGTHRNYEGDTSEHLTVRLMELKRRHLWQALKSGRVLKRWIRSGDCIHVPFVKLYR